MKNKKMLRENLIESSFIPPGKNQLQFHSTPQEFDLLVHKCAPKEDKILNCPLHHQIISS